MRAACAGFARVELSSDAYTALIGAFEGGPGALLVIGTGSVGCVLDRDGSSRQLGGWGFPAGDGGSGAWIGLRLLGAWLEFRDGIGEDSLLCPGVSAALPQERAAILDWMRARPVGRLRGARPAGAGGRRGGGSARRGAAGSCRPCTCCASPAA